MKSVTSVAGTLGTITGTFPSLKIRFFACGVIAFYFLMTFNCGTTFGKTYIGKQAGSCKGLRAVARLYMARGDYKKAQPFAERALTVAKATQVSDAQLSACLIDLAWLYLKQGKLSDAEDVCRQGLQLQKQAYFNNHPYIAYTLRILSSICQGRGKYRQAELSLRKAYAIMAKSHPLDDQVMAPFHVDIAALLAAQGKFQQAQIHYSQAMDLLNNSCGQEHLYTANVLSSMAGLYTLKQEYNSAESLINRACSIQQRIYGPDNHLLASTWITMAQIYQARGDYSQAEKLLHKALSAVESHLGAEHPLVGTILTGLGDLYIAEGKYSQAETACYRAVEVLESCLGTDNDRTAMAFNNMARLYIHQGKYELAQDLCQRALSTLQNIFGSDHLSVVQVQKTMADLQNITASVAKVAKLEKFSGSTDLPTKLASQPAFETVK